MRNIKSYIPEYFINKTNTLQQVLFTSLFAFFFINIYKPFSAGEWYAVSWYLFSFVSGILVMAGMLVVVISRLVLLKISKNKGLSVWVYAIAIGSEVFFMGLLYAFLERIILGDVRPFPILLYLAVQNTSLILLIPYLISLLFFAWREKKMSLDALIRQLRNKPHFIAFKDENQVLRVTLKAEDLIYIEASDNYVVLYYLNGIKTKTYLLRNTLKNLESQLKDYPLLRCHRSYMINMDKVKMLKKEKGRFFLQMDEMGSVLLPVSKSYNSKVTAAFEI